MKVTKTNVMRILDKQHIAYSVFTYDPKKISRGDLDVATHIQQDPSLIYKTLVLEHNNALYVAVIPIHSHLDMKKAAIAFGVKKVELLHVHLLLAHTGYVRGGCSPIGMKKHFPTCIDQSAQALDTMIVSAGKVGTQIGLAPQHLIQTTQSSYADLTA